MAKYDIGVLGLWPGCNYGSVATYYALNQVLTSMGKSVLMIDKPILSNRDIELKMTHSRRFAMEHYNISEQYHPNELYKLNQICDTFVIGSDQVWNYGISKNFGKIFYFDFVEEEKKKIAYAVSFGHGVDFAPPEERKVIAEYMAKIDGISVREADGVRLCRDEYGIKAEQVLDPVFLADPQIYQPIIEKSTAHETEPFLAAYILDPTPEKREAILHLSQKLGGIKIINLLDGVPGTFEKNRQLTDLPNCIENLQVEDWLYYLSHAEYVITDSCHGASFAIIFNKNLTAIANKLRGFSRFKSLFDLFGIQSHLVTDPKMIIDNEKLLLPIDYDKVKKITDKQRTRCRNWLSGVLNEPKPSAEVLKKRNVIVGAFSKKQTKSKAIMSVLDMKQCTGCGACVSACPKDALSLQQDNWGYYRSSLNAELCIDCGLCSKICPALSLPRKTNKKEPPLYAFIAADEKVLESSSSGGIFPLLANEAFKRGGCVSGAAWTGDLHVEHILIENKEELHKLQKSKYLQSYLGDFDRKIKEKLDAGRFVLFTGCPCQVTGLKAYLGKDYDNLITADLLCGNSPSSEFFQKYLKDSFPKGVKDYQFRYKKQGWNSDCLTLTLTDGTKIDRRGGGQDDYQKLYHPHVMCPPHCEQCKYQALPRFGDITIGDFWGYAKHDNSIDTSKGISAVLCNNEKGQAFFDSINDEAIKVKKTVPLEWLGGNGYAYAGHNYCSPNRDKFYKAIQTMPFSEAMKTALTPNRLSSYPDPLSLQPLHYDTSQLRFRFDENMWEEHFINGHTVLITKTEKPILGNYAVMPLMHPLVKGKKYCLSVCFKVKTTSNDFSFHIKESDSKHIQIIYKHQVVPDDAIQWRTKKIYFIPNSDVYDEFMIGSAHICGQGRFFAVDYINISDV